MDQFYVYFDDGIVLVDHEEVDRFVADGTLGLDSMVCPVGGAAWRPLHEAVTTSLLVEAGVQARPEERLRGKRVSLESDTFRYEVTVGEATVGPVSADLLRRGWLLGRVPPEAVVRPVTAWRAVHDAGVEPVGTYEVRRGAQSPATLRGEEIARCLAAGLFADDVELRRCLPALPIAKFWSSADGRFLGDTTLEAWEVATLVFDRNPG